MQKRAAPCLGHGEERTEGLPQCRNTHGPDNPNSFFSFTHAYCQPSQGLGLITLEEIILEATEASPNQLYSYTTEGGNSFQKKKQHAQVIDREILLQSHMHILCGNSIVLQVEE